MRQNLTLLLIAKALVSLSWRERRIALATAVRLGVIALMLRRRLFHRLLARIERGGRAAHLYDSHGLMRDAWVVSQAAAHLPGGRNCLVRSMALHWFLRNAGARSELRIGVNTEGDMLDAHSWVELDGSPLLEAADVSARYPVLRNSAA